MGQGILVTLKWVFAWLRAVLAKMQRWLLQDVRNILFRFVYQGSVDHLLFIIAGRRNIYIWRWRLFVIASRDTDDLIALPMDCGRTTGIVLVISLALDGIKQADTPVSPQLHNMLGEHGMGRCKTYLCVSRSTVKGLVSLIVVRKYVNDIILGGKRMRVMNLPGSWSKSPNNSLEGLESKGVVG